MCGGPFPTSMEALISVSDAQLDARVRHLETERRRVEAELAATIAVADARCLYARDGHRSIAGYLRATCNWSGAEVGRFRSAARLVDQHPEVGQAWSSGRLGGAQVAELSKAHGNRRVADRFADFVPTLVEHARNLRYDEFRVVMQRFTLLADSDGTHDDRDAAATRRATVVEVAGSLEVRASGGNPLQTAEFLAIFDRFVDREFQVDRERLAEDPSAVARTGPQRRFDALLAMAQAAASHDGMISTAEPLVSVLVDQRTWSWVIAHSGLGAATSLSGVSIDPFTGLPSTDGLLDDLVGEPEQFEQRRCETSTGVLLRPHDVLRAALSGHMRRVVLGADRRPIDLGRSARVFTGAARDAAKLLVDWCQHPGCDLPAQLCQVDHIIEWNASGSTDQDNAGIRCGFHNREKHRTRRTVKRIGGRSHTCRPDGVIILPVGADPPCEPNDVDPSDDMGLADPVESPEYVERLEQTARHRLAMLTVHR